MSLVRHQLQNTDHLESYTFKEEGRSLPLAIKVATSSEKMADLMLRVITAKHKALALMDSREKCLILVDSEFLQHW